MKHWTRRRWASLGIHVAFVSVPFSLSTASALLFWRDMFQSWALAIPMVAVIEVLSLVGLILFLTRIESPFVAIRHLLPFISIVPLGREMYLLLAHNPPAVAWGLTALATGILVVIAWQCFGTIERLFMNDPEIVAQEQADALAYARSHAHAQAAAMAQELAQAEATISILRTFAARHLVDMAQGATQPMVAPAATEQDAWQPLMISATDDAQSLVAAVVYDGATYPTIQAAATAHGITRQAMSKRLKKERP